MSEAVIVRALTEDDLAMVLAWRNHPEIRRFMFTQHEITLIEHLQWFKKNIQDSSRRLLIVQEDSIPIGYVQFNNVQIGGEADWGFYLRPNVANGTGWKLGSAALEHAFIDLKLNKVCGQAIESNYKSIRFHERLGFKRDKERIYFKEVVNELKNIVCFEIHFDEWKSLNLK